VDDGRRPRPPRERWGAHELGAAWDDALDPAALLPGLSERDQRLVLRAAAGLADDDGCAPSARDRRLALAMVQAAFARVPDAGAN
jgi:hypothetical protein